MTDEEKLADCIKRLSRCMAKLHSIDSLCRLYAHPGCNPETHKLASRVLQIIKDVLHGR